MAIPFTLFVFIFTSILSSSVLYAEPSSHPRPFEAIYAFGDSYTDTGNTRSNTGPNGFTFVSNLPYGSTFFHHPTNRYSDGRLMIDFLAKALSLPFLPPYLDHKADKSSGVNFAVAGSTAIIHTFFVKNNMTLNITPQSLLTQLTWFNKFLEGKGCKDSTTTPAECKVVFNDALIWVGEIGANDYAYSFPSSVPKETVQKLAISSVTGFLQVSLPLGLQYDTSVVAEVLGSPVNFQALLKKGAKYVVVQGLPPTGCLTLSMYLAPRDDRDGVGCVGSANKQSYTHNSALKAKLDVFRKQFPQSIIVYADYYNAYLTVMKNAPKYGLKELYKVCCGYGGGQYNFNYLDACGSPSTSACANPSQYINWDGVHLTEAMYKAMADAFWNGTFSQPPFNSLLSKKQQSA